MIHHFSSILSCRHCLIIVSIFFLFKFNPDIRFQKYDFFCGACKSSIKKKLVSVLNEGNA